MGSGHSHAPGHGAAGRAGERHRHRLALALVLSLVLFVAELVTALAANSLALLSDAGHMLTDVVGLGMALAAVSVASRVGASGHRTFGLYRLEILAALANTVLLVGVAVYVLVEAVHRLIDPEPIDAGPVLVVAVLGLVVNLVALLLLREGSDESLNVHGAYLEVLADLLGSIGVIVAAGIVAVTGWDQADAVIGAAIGLFILPRAVRLGAQALRILLQMAPPDLDLDALAGDLAGIPGVVDVHDLHVWTLTSEMDVASAHLMIGAGTDAHGVLDQARDVLTDRYRVTHATLQVEPDDHVGCEELDW